MSPVDEVATNGEHLPKLMLPILPKTIASVEKPCKSRGHVSDNCQGYMFLLYKCFKEIINSWNYDFLIFLPFTIWYIVSTFFWKTSSDLPQSTRWYNTTVVLSQTAIYPTYELLVAGITKRPKIRLHETSIHYSNYGIPEFLDSGRNSWTLDFGRWTLHSGHWTLDARRDT